MIEASKTDWAIKPGDDSATTLRVLLAEDTPINAEAMKAMARRLAVEMDVAANGLDAIEMIDAAEAEGHPYSLMLVDVMMPILDGVETTKRLRERGYDADKLPIIAVTAATSFDEIRSYKAYGMQAFLSKPVALKDLRATLQAWGHRAEEKPAAIPAAILEELQGQFERRNKHTLQAIEEALASDHITEEAIGGIRRVLHQIAGTATTFGDAKLSKAARKHENALTEIPHEQDTVRKALEAARKSLKQRIKS